MGKSAAKIRRNIARAAARGETYTPPEPKPKPAANAAGDPAEGGGDDDGDAPAKAAAARKLERALAELESNPDGLNAKERRSAKRKAEAVAAEEAGCDATALLEWHEGRREAEAKKRGRKQRSDDRTTTDPTESLSEEDKAKFASAKKLHESLAALEKDDSLNAKDRRSAKRKAEAIASEETSAPSKELLEWYEAVRPAKASGGGASSSSDGKGKKIPYIVFVGQLAYTTTADMLFDHFRSTLSSEIIAKDAVKVRLLTDPKTKKSRGMAFVELDSPEAMYECLKMHLTHLDGRRINVERSAGGGTASKKAKITTFRESQTNYISETMDHILSGFLKSAEIEPEELDEGVVALCKRHSATVVEAALKEYVAEKKDRKAKKETLGEKEEENLRNPSAFLTHMIGRIAEEGVGNSRGGAGGGGGRGRGRGGGRSGGRGGGPGRGSGGAGRGGRGGRGGYESVLKKSGVDMEASSRGGVGGSRNAKISQIFPSMQRGRGRGRGYM
ncbi:hypothetical protein ACHAWF_005238 [Thalassiosira exigua]